MESSMRNLSLKVVILVFALFVSTSVCAAATYVIRKGDNPQTIGRKFNTSPREIIRVNGLEPKRLRPGTRIRIPDKGETLRKSKSPNDGKTAGSKSKKTTAGAVEGAVHRADTSFHTVRKGDPGLPCGWLAA